MQPRILIAATTWWAMPARVASAFLKLGAYVSAVVPRGSPVATVRSLGENCRYSAKCPLKSLTQAIYETNPDIIIPCDDRVVEHLHELHFLSSRSGDVRISDLIERSLGSPIGYHITSSRATLLELAHSLGVVVPETRVVQTMEALREFVEEYGFPLVLKVDGTWGGTGIRIVSSMEEAETAFAELTRSLSLMIKLQHICNHDFFPLFSESDRRRKPITAQVYVKGRSANMMVACWEGNVLETISVETLFAVEELGSSTIVRTILDPNIESAGRLLAEKLAMSGFFGLDFIVESESGNPYLIELNPRATQNGHLEPGGRPSLVSALYRRLMGHTPPPAMFVEETIAFFPHILRSGANVSIPDSSKMFQDVPWDEPELIKELVRKPWNRRHLSSLLYSGGRKFVEIVSR